MTKSNSSAETIKKSQRARYWNSKGKSPAEISEQLFREGLVSSKTRKKLSVSRVRELIDGVNWYSKEQKVKEIA